MLRYYRQFVAPALIWAVCTAALNSACSETKPDPVQKTCVSLEQELSDSLTTGNSPLVNQLAANLEDALSAGELEYGASVLWWELNDGMILNDPVFQKAIRAVAPVARTLSFSCAAGSSPSSRTPQGIDENKKLFDDRAKAELAQAVKNYGFVIAGTAAIICYGAYKHPGCAIFLVLAAAVVAAQEPALPPPGEPANPELYEKLVKGTTGSGGSNTGGTHGGGAPSSMGGGAPGGSTGDGGSGGAGGTTGAGGAGGGCAETSVPTYPVLDPVDFILVVDNSASMAEEIASIEQNINPHFGSTLGALGVDYQVVAISTSGPGIYELCIGPPLSAGTCSATNSGKFYQLSIDVGSWDALCDLLQNVGQISSWLRPLAKKEVIVVTDDRANCSVGSVPFDDGNASTTGQIAATNWDSALLLASPSNFGSSQERRYRFHSIIGLSEEPLPITGYSPTAPILGSTCAGGIAPGYGYQWLSVITGGLRFASCQYPSYGDAFETIASDAASEATSRCRFTMSAVPSGTLEVKMMNGATLVEKFQQVSSLGNCGTNPSAFYIDGLSMTLCPSTCTKVETNPTVTTELVQACQ